MPIRKLLIINLCLAIAYFLLGKLGLFLALPPGYISAIWPPAGLAFAACILWQGRYVWPGIFLGSVLVNSSVGSNFNLDSVAVCIAIGSTIQALCGGWLARKVDPTMLLNRSANILKFSAVGLGSALIAASIGNLTLYLHGFLAPNQVLQSYLTWWLGDALGIQIFTPLLLLLLDQREAWRVRRISVGAPLLIAFFLCGTVYYHVRSNEEQQLFSSFHGQIERITADLSALEQSHLQAVTATAAYLEIEPDLHADHFAKLSQHLLSTSRGIRALSWAPMINLQKLNEYKTLSEHIWGKPLTIRSWPSPNPNAGEKAFPVTLITPLKGNEAALGFDLYSEPIRAQAIDTLLKTNKPSISQQIKLVQDPSGPGGMLILAPIHQQGQIIGIASGVLDLRYVHSILSRLQDVQWQLTDVGHPVNSARAALLSNIKGPIPEFSTARYLDRSGIYFKETLHIANHEWQLILHRPQAKLISIASIAPLLVIFMSLSVCGVLANLALMLSGERQRIGEEVAEKTAALRQEVTERRKAEAVIEQQVKNLALLNEISSLPDHDLSTKLQTGLVLSRDLLQLDFGIISRINGDDFEVIAAVSPDNSISQNLHLELEKTYCSLTLKNDELLTIEQMSKSPYADHPCYRIWGLESYIGIPIHVHGNRFGTLSFSSKQASQRQFEEGDHEFVRLLAKWVEASIEHDLGVEQLRHAKIAAEQASASKSQFLASMSHEIRTPMNGILGMLKLLEHSDLNQRQLDYTNKAQSATLALLGIINDILDFSKVEAGKMELEISSFNLNDVIRDLAVLLTPNLDGKTVELLFALDPELPVNLMGDPLRLRQVLLNLSGNAMKFTEQGEVLVSLHAIASTEESTTIEFSVQDTGIGIAPDKLNYIFEGFSQAEASTTRRFGGTGLGLAISKNLVQLMGSNLQVESEPGKGSRFYFSLTLGRSSTSDLAPKRPAPANFRILIVDDNAHARDILKQMVGTLGYVADCVSNGPEALQIIEAMPATHYQLLLIDWQMPGMDGLETTRRLRQMEHGNYVPILIMATTHEREIISEHTKNEPHLLDGFAIKPITPDMLNEAIDDTLLTHIDHPGKARGPINNQPLKGLRLLVVEDNLLNQQVARELLSRNGGEVAIAGGGIDGVNQALAANPAFDAILMDMQMPDIDGLEATQRILAHPRMLATPIIAMTANAMSSDKEACLAAGMVDHISKPIDIEEVIATLLKHTRQIEEPVITVAPFNQAEALPTDFRIDSETAIKRLGGDAELYQEIIADFPAEARKQFSLLEQSLDSNQLEEAMRAVHTLKSLASMIGAEVLAAQAAVRESELRHHLESGTSQLETPAPWLAELSFALEQTLENSLRI